MENNGLRHRGHNNFQDVQNQPEERPQPKTIKHPDEALVLILNEHSERLSGETKVILNQLKTELVIYLDGEENVKIKIDIDNVVHEFKIGNGADYCLVTITNNQVKKVFTTNRILPTKFTRNHRIECFGSLCLGIACSPLGYVIGGPTLACLTIVSGLGVGGLISIAYNKAIEWRDG